MIRTRHTLVLALVVALAVGFFFVPARAAAQPDAPSRALLARISTPEWQALLARYLGR